MIQLLTRSGILGLIILFVLNVVLKLKYLLQPASKLAYWNTEQNWLINITTTNSSFVKNPNLWVGLSIVLIYILGIVITYILRTEKFINRNNYTPLLSVIIVTSLHPVFVLFSDYLLISAIIIWCLQKTINVFKTERLRIELLNIGILVGICTDIKIGMYMLLIVTISNLMFIRRLNLNDFIAVSIGFLIPIYFGYAYHYFFSEKIFNAVTKVSIKLPQYVLEVDNLLTALFMFLLMLIYANYVAYKTSLNKKIQFQKMWNTFNITTLGLLLISFISSSLPSTAFVMPFLIGNFVIYLCFNNTFKPAWNNIALLLSILVVILNQYFLK